MSPKKKALGVTLILVIYVVIAILGFFVAYYVKTNILEPKQQANIPKPTAVPAPSGYKTYESPDQQFSLVYPESMEVKENPIGFGVKTVEIRSQDNTDPIYEADIRILTVPKMLAKTIGQDFETFYEMQNNETKTIENPDPENKSAEAFTKIRNREINGLRALDYNSTPSPNPDNQEPEIGTFVEAGNNLVFFATSPDGREQLEEVLRTFNYNQ